MIITCYCGWRVGRSRGLVGSLVGIGCRSLHTQKIEFDTVHRSSDQTPHHMSSSRTPPLSY